MNQLSSIEAGSDGKLIIENRGEEWRAPGADPGLHTQGFTFRKDEREGSIETTVQGTLLNRGLWTASLELGTLRHIFQKGLVTRRLGGRMPGTGHQWKNHWAERPWIQALALTSSVTLVQSTSSPGGSVSSSYGWGGWTRKSLRVPPIQKMKDLVTALFWACCDTSWLVTLDKCLPPWASNS